MIYYALAAVPHVIVACIYVFGKGALGCIPPDSWMYLFPLYLIALLANFIVAVGYTMPKENTHKLRWFLALNSGLLYVVFALLSIFHR
jgi:hypothetical protein